MFVLVGISNKSRYDIGKFPSLFSSRSLRIHLRGATRYTYVYTYMYTGICKGFGLRGLDRSWVYSKFEA